MRSKDRIGASTPSNAKETGLRILEPKAENSGITESSDLSRIEQPLETQERRVGTCRRLAPTKGA